MNSRQQLCDIYIRRDALRMLQKLDQILPITKETRPYRDELFQNSRPYGDEVSVNNIV